MNVSFNEDLEYDANFKKQFCWIACKNTWFRLVYTKFDTKIKEEAAGFQEMIDILQYQSNWHCKHFIILVFQSNFNSKNLRSWNDAKIKQLWGSAKRNCLSFVCNNDMRH